MALLANNLYLANSKYTYTIDGQQSCGGEADIFDIQRKKADIMNEMLKNVNNQLYKVGLVAIFDYYDGNNEDYNFFSIHRYIDGWSYNDYLKANKSIGFGFIENKLI